MKTLFKSIFLLFISLFIFTGCAPKAYEHTVLNLKAETVPANEIEGYKDNTFLILTGFLQRDEQILDNLGYALNPEHFAHLYGIAKFAKIQGFNYFSFVSPLKQTQYRLQTNDIDYLLEIVRTQNRFQFPRKRATIKYIDEDKNKIEIITNCYSVISFSIEQPYEYFSFSVDKLLESLKKPEYGFDEDNIITSHISMAELRQSNVLKSFTSFEDIAQNSKK